MAETTADVRRDIELTRERMTSTLAQLEQKLNLTQVVRDNPWPALGLALGAGFLLSGSGADVKAAHATRSMTLSAKDGTRNRLGPALDDALSRLMVGLSEAVTYQIDRVVADVQRVVGLPGGAQGDAERGAQPGGAGGPQNGPYGGPNDGRSQPANGDGNRAAERAGQGGGPPAASGSNPYTGGSGSWAPQSADTEAGSGTNLGSTSNQALGRVD